MAKERLTRSQKEDRELSQEIGQMGSLEERRDRLAWASFVRLGKLLDEMKEGNWNR